MFISCLFLVLFASVGLSEAYSEVRAHDARDFDNYDDQYSNVENSDYQEFSFDEERRVVVNFLKYVLGLATKNQKTHSPTGRPRQGKLFSRPGNYLPVEESRYRAEEAALNRAEGASRNRAEGASRNRAEGASRSRAEGASRKDFDDNAELKRKTLEQLDQLQKMYSRLEQQAAAN